MRDLIRYITQIQYEDLCLTSRQSAKLALMDTLGALIKGSQEEEIQSLAELWSKRDPGSFHVLGTGYKTNLQHAAFLNGCSSVAIEMDEGNQWSKGHPAAHIIPILSTFVQGIRGVTGKQFLLSLVTGYEVCSRLGRATTLLPSAHAHGTWGTLGATAGLMLLNKFSEEHILAGIELSSSFALPTKWSAALEGAFVRNAYAGHAAEVAIRVLDMVKSGFRAPNRNTEYVFSEVLGTKFDEEALMKDLGKDWDINLNYFKPYPFCRYAHAPLDAFLQILSLHPIQKEEIEHIEVRTYERAATLNNCAPHNALSAKFSIPYALAAYFILNSTDQLDIFSQEHLNHPQILELSQKIKVVSDSQLEQEYPNIMPAIVRIITKNTIYVQRCNLAKGSIDSPLEEKDIELKFKSLTDSILTTKEQENILTVIRNLEDCSDVAHWIR